MLSALYLLSTLAVAHPAYLAAPSQAEIVDVVAHGGRIRWRHGSSTDTDIDPPCTSNCGAGSPSETAGWDGTPLSYTVTDLPGTEFYISTGGGGSTCSSGSPCATLAAAQTAAGANDSVVVKSGTYHNIGSSCTWSSGVCTYTSQTAITDHLTIACEPGGTCIFDGAQDVTATFAAGTVEGGNTYIAYSPIPVTDGSGTTFATGGSNYNLSNGVEGVGKFSDQAWIGTTELTQVRLKSELVAGKFWVDSTFPLGNTVSVSSTVNTTRVTGTNTQFSKVLAAGDSITVGAVSNSLAAPVGTIQTRTILTVDSDTQLTVTSAFLTTVSNTRIRRNGNHRLYLVTSDADCNGSTCEVSSKQNFLSINASGVELKGITVERYSNTLAKFGILIVNNQADTFKLTSVLFDSCALTCMSLAGDTSAGLLDNITFSHVSITNMKFLGINPVYTNTLTVDLLKCTGSDPLDEYTASPQSGCMKLSRTYGTVITNSRIADNRMIGIWFDETNQLATVCNNTIVNNGAVTGETSFFFEISDRLILCNNYIQSPIRPGAKMSGSSGIRAWNNTFVGGADPFEMTADSRSNLTLHCADPAFALCSGSFASNRWTSSIIARASTADWMPRLDEFFNNIVVNPTGTSDVCNVSTAFCVNAYHGTAPGSEATIQSIIHPADVGRGIPATTMNTNVYANGTSGNIIARRINSGAATTYTQAALATWTSYLAGAPVSISGLDASSIADPTGTTYVDAAGVPTGSLTHSNATAIPSDIAALMGVSVGTKRFGVNWSYVP